MNALLCNNCGKPMRIVNKPDNLPVDVQLHVDASIPETMVFWACDCGRRRLTSIAEWELI
jgi:hypothetical protein